MRAGRAAGAAIVVACRNEGVSDAALEAYPRAWARDERNLRFAHQIYRRIVDYDDAAWDREIEQLTRLSAPISSHRASKGSSRSAGCSR